MKLTVKNLKRLRIEKEISQRELARRANLTQAGISLIENKEDCLLSTALRYAEGIDVKLKITDNINDLI